MTPAARFLLTATALANLLLNLLFPVLAVRALGAGADTDALFMVFVLPGVITVLLGNSVLNWLTPRLVRRQDPASRRLLCWGLLWTLSLGVAALCLLLWAGGSVALAGREPDSYTRALEILPWGIVAVLVSVAAALAQCLYIAERDVPAGESRALLGGVLVLAVWLAVSPATLEACALLFMLRALAVTVLVMPRLGKPGGLAWSDTDLRDILRESRLLLLAATYYKTEPFVDRLLFASAPGGAVAAYHLAGQLLAVVTQMVQRTLIAPLIAPFAEAVHRADLPRMRRIIYGTYVRVLILGLTVWALIIFAGEPLLGWMFSGSGVEPAHLALTADMLNILGGFMMAVLFGLVSAQVCYCTGETRRVVVYSSAAYTVGLVIKLLMFWQFGVIGLVAAVSFSWLLNVVWFFHKIEEMFAGVEQRGPLPAAV